MKKSKIYIVFLVLFTIILVQIYQEHHNHTPLEKESSSCPAYMIHSQFFSPMITYESVSAEFRVVYDSIIDNHQIPFFNSFPSFSYKRAPPII